jgi:hypothetical protein
MARHDPLRPVLVTESDGRGSQVTYQTVAQVTRLFPPSRNGRPVHVATVTRWIVVGVRLRDGTVLRLRAVRAPGRWLVEPGAVQEFLEALRADRVGTSTSTPPDAGPAPLRTRAARRKDAERAGRELDEIGIGGRQRGPLDDHEIVR